MIGIITAIQEEFDAVSSVIENKKDYHLASMEIVTGNIGTNEVVLAKCGQGKVNAACCTQLIIDRFGADPIINIGIGGALSDELRVGDVVISEDTIQYDMDGRGEGFDLGQVPELDVLAFKADGNLIDQAVSAAQSNGVSYKLGRVLTADLFLSDKNKKNEIVDLFNGIICEMEGAAIAQVCYLNGISFLIIRAVSDTAEDTAEEMVMMNLEKAMNQTINMTRDMIKNYE